MDTTELVEFLRNEARWDLTETPQALCEAADLIEKQAAEIERLTEIIRSAQEKLGEPHRGLRPLNAEKVIGVYSELEKAF